MIKETEKIEETAGQSGRMSGDERRAQVLRVAIGLFSKRGFVGTTTKEIANAAGVSEAIIFRHFATKDELYRAILDFKACEGGFKSLPWDVNTAENKAIREDDDFNVFYNLAFNTLEHHEKDVDFMRLLFHSALEGHELAQMFFDRFISRLYEFLGAYIAKRQEAGAMREINPRLVVRAFLGMLIHHSLNNILWDKQRRLLNVSNEEAARTFAEILLRGVEIKK